MTNKYDTGPRHTFNEWNYGTIKRDKLTKNNLGFYSIAIFTDYSV